MTGDAMPGFRLPVEDAARVFNALWERWTVVRETEPERCRTWFDTFDWRLHNTGWRLWSERVGQQLPRLCLQRSAGGILHEWRREATPETVPEPLRDVVEMRRILPLATVHLQGETIRLLDRRQKTVVLVRRLEGTAEAPAEGVTGGAPTGPATGETYPLPTLLEINPLKGYEAEGEAVADVLRSLDLETTSEDLFSIALSRLGRRPGDYGAKIHLELDAAMPADEALRRILGRLLETVERNEEGTRRDLDSEFLHDFRVAVRRCRSALSQVKGVLPPTAVSRLQRELKWLGDRTGPTRDLDVYLLKMDSYKAALPASAAHDLAPLDAFLRRHQRQEQGRLVRSLNSRRYRRLLEIWRGVAEAEEAGSPQETPTEERPTEETPDATRPVREVAVERIDRALRKVLKKGRKIDRDTPAAAIHRLRIDCKKLRYLLELFAGTFDRKTLQLPIKALKRLQDTLGDFNDFEVQQETLQRFAHQMVEEGLLNDPQKGADTLLAMGRLQDRLTAGQIEERQRFHRRFDRFASSRVQRSFDHLLGADV